MPEDLHHDMRHDELIVNATEHCCTAIPSSKRNSGQYCWVCCSLRAFCLNKKQKTSSRVHGSLQHSIPTRISAFDFTTSPLLSESHVRSDADTSGAPRVEKISDVVMERSRIAQQRLDVIVASASNPKGPRSIPFLASQEELLSVPEWNHLIAGAVDDEDW
jgi:hypothetical protein